MQRLFFLVYCLAAITISTAVSFAQEQICLDNVSKICGDKDASDCFAIESNWKLVKPECEGDVQTLVEMASEANEQALKEGASLGGKIRSGPGIEYAQTGSLSEGDLVSLEENTGVMMNGYPWFKIIQYDNSSGAEIVSGYQWGGILCSFNIVSGVFNQCPSEWLLGEQSNNSIGEDAIAPTHGNSDEDNLDIDLAKIASCLEDEAQSNRDGTGCIGRISEACLEKRDDTTIDMRECINFERIAWDKMLNDDYRNLMASLDAETKKEKLRDAQRNWNKFVDSFCPLAYEFNQGTMFLITRDQCVMEMTARQDLELKRLSGGSQPN
jgi:uncharacterized protein YecT (DUF1311 family)